MAQTTNYEIANSSGLIFRGRVNEVFAAVQSNNSGTTGPTGTVAYQLWYDTTNNILKMRSASNAAWIDLFTVDQTNGVWSVNSSSSSSALRITQTGTGNALLVEDSANPDSTPFVVTADGNVGIGIITPSTALEVVGQASFDDGTAAAPSITNTGDLNTGILFPAADTVAVSTAGSERLRVGSTGTVFFAGSSTEGVFDGTGVNVAATGEVSINVNSGAPLDLNQSQNDNIARAMIRFYRREIVNGSITTSSTATAYVTSSDYRLKKNVQPMTGALGVVAQLKPVTYTWKTDGSGGQGFIAHELQAVVPDCVIGEKDAVGADGKPEHQGVDTSFLVATLTAAIQEQQAIITALTARVSALEG